MSGWEPEPEPRWGRAFLVACTMGLAAWVAIFYFVAWVFDLR